jgi:hypothetical protein
VNAPDLIEPIIGFRQWRLCDGGLRSLACEYIWPAAEVWATCLAGGHPAPEHACACGIYAWYTPCPRTASAATADYVAGALVLWGRVELHATGMRGEHARIVALALARSPGRKRRRLIAVADRFGVPAVPHRALRGIARVHGAPISDALRGGAAPR